MVNLYVECGPFPPSQDASSWHLGSPGMKKPQGVLDGSCGTSMADLDLKVYRYNIEETLKTHLKILLIVQKSGGCIS